MGLRSGLSDPEEFDSSLGHLGSSWDGGGQPKAGGAGVGARRDASSVW